MNARALLWRALLLALPGLAAGWAPAAAATDCPLTDQSFSDAVDALADWQGVRDHQKTYFPPCADEGAYAQTHSELVTRMLAARWSEIAVLDSLVSEAPDFRDFVLRHVNARGTRADLQTVLTYATIRCPRRQAAFCSQIRGAAAKALEELR